MNKKSQAAFVQSEMHEMDFFLIYRFLVIDIWKTFLSEKKVKVIFFRHTFRHAVLYAIRHRTRHAFLTSVDVKISMIKNAKTTIKLK